MKKMLKQRKSLYQVYTEGERQQKRDEHRDLVTAGKQQRVRERRDAVGPEIAKWWPSLQKCYRLLDCALRQEKQRLHDNDVSFPLRELRPKWYIIEGPEPRTQQSIHMMGRSDCLITPAFIGIAELYDQLGGCVADLCRLLRDEQGEKHQIEYSLCGLQLFEPLVPGRIAT
jgi:hypothetical protein